MKYAPIYVTSMFEKIQKRKEIFLIFPILNVENVIKYSMENS